MSEIYGFDAYSPDKIALKVQEVGVAKAHLSFLPLVMLSMLAGAFIGLGGMLFVLVKSDATLGFAVTQIIGGGVFSLGLILVVVAGAELFTGNNLLVIAWAEGKITTNEILKNWALVCVANFIGAIGLACMVYFSGHTDLNGGAIAQQYVKVASAKAALPFMEAFFKGVLCNVLVCMAVWMAIAGRSVTDKAIAIVFPITAFVAAGFEHSVANMFFFPMAMLVEQFSDDLAPSVSLLGFFNNLLPVLLGNIVGGGGFVALVYHFIYPTKNKPGLSK